MCRESGIKDIYIYIQHQNIGYHLDIARDASYLYHVTCVCCHMHVVGKSIWKIQNYCSTQHRKNVNLDVAAATARAAAIPIPTA